MLFAMGYLGEKVLNDGDVVNIDVTLILDGWHGDTSRMYSAGEPSIKSKNLINTTYESLMLSLDMIKPGVFLVILEILYKIMQRIEIFLL